MNQIVRKVVPVSSLPAELQTEFDPAGEVEIVGQAVQSGANTSLLDTISEYQRTHETRFRDSDDVVAYIRAVRDGGDLEPWLGPCSTSKPTF
jgi:hypothetical protein